MNYNYVNYMTPADGAYPNSAPNGNANPSYGYNAQAGHHQNGYGIPAQRQPMNPPQQQHQQYAAYPPNAYSNPYQPPTSPAQTQTYSNPMVVIPQRVPSQPGYSPSSQNFIPPPPSPYRAQPPTQIQHNQWQGVQQHHSQPQPQPQPVHYQSYQRYPVHSPVVQQPPVQRTKAMVEIPLPQPQHKIHRPSSGQASSSSSNVPTVKKEESRPPEPVVEYDLVLLSLAEEYINAAHSIGPTVALYRRSEDMEKYYQLVAMGMSCMEAVLKVRGLFCPKQVSELISYRISDFSHGRRRGSLCNT
jgi:hypothetical protein